MSTMSNSLLFIDSSFFCAFYNPKDNLNQKASLLAPIVKNYSAISSNFVFLESTTVISQRVGKAEAVLFGDSLLNQSVIDLHYFSNLEEADIWKIFKRVKNKNMSYVDCSILSLIQKYKINALLTFDTHFKPFEKQFNFKVIQ